MTETEVQFSKLPKQLAHLTECSEEGWVLQWGDSPETRFEVVCRKANALQVERMAALISEGHRQAVLQRS